MQRSFRKVTVAATAVAMLTIAVSPAWASGEVDIDLGGGEGSSTVTVGATDPGSGGGSGGGGGGGSSSDGGGGTAPVDNAGSTPVGNYDNGPPRPAWEQAGATDADRAAALTAGVTSYRDENGTPWSYTDPASGVADGGWNSGAQVSVPGEPAPGGDAAASAPQIDPAVLAQTASSQMGLEAPEIASTPNDTDTLGAVGLPVWLWVANPGATTTGPNSTSATAGAVTVNATATFSGMTIDMGDGTTIECSSPGTAYPGKGIYESPDCGHVYEQMSDDQPGGLYTVTITAHWTVNWDSNTGATGTIPIDLTTTKQLRIGSYQTVVTDVS